MKINYIAPRIIQTFFWIPVRLVLTFFADMKVYGMENLKSLDSSSAIFASNHTSEMDPIITTSVISPFSRFSPMFYVSRGSDFYTDSGWRSGMYGGRLFALCGAYPAIPGKKSYEKSLALHIKILLNNHSVYIFPEGGFDYGTEITEKVHGGVAFLSKRTNLPIVPIAIKGASNTTVYNFFSRKKKYVISFGRPMYPRDILGETYQKIELSAEDYKNGAKVVMRRIGELYAKL